MADSRFSLAALLRAVTCLAIFFAYVAALWSGSNDAVKTCYTLTFVMLLYAAISVRFRSAFWYGFAIVGWAFFIVGYGPWIIGGPHSSSGTTNRLLISSVLVEIGSGFLTIGDRPANVDRFGTELVRHNLEGICHSALTVIFATLGGFVACRMATSQVATATKCSSAALTTNKTS